jgi:hypothetical protein
MTPERYMSFIAAEDAFTRLYKGPIENAAYTMRLFARVLKQYTTYRDKHYAKTTLAHFLRRFRSQPN